MRLNGTRPAPSHFVSRFADLEQAQQIAVKTGAGYQAVLKQAIREGLKRAG